MKISQEMRDIIKKSRKLQRTLWKSEQTNMHYIGYGHLVNDKDVDKYLLKKMSKKEAEALLEDDLKSCEKFVNSFFELDDEDKRRSYGIKTIPQNHYDVFCHIVYELGACSEERVSSGGPSMLKGSSFFLLYKKGLISESAERIMIWSKYKGIQSQSLYNRRKLDYQIFTTNQYKSENKHNLKSDLFKHLL